MTPLTALLALTVLAAVPAAAFHAAPAFPGPAPLRAALTQLRHKSAVASLGMQLGRREALSLGALGVIGAPAAASAGGIMAGFRERITGEREGAVRASERLKVDTSEQEACNIFQCIEVTEDTFTGEALEPFKAEGASIRVPQGWAKSSEDGALGVWTGPKGATVRLIKRPVAEGVVFKSVEGQPAQVAQSILKLDVVQVGNRVGKLIGAEYVGGRPRLLKPENLLVYAMGLRSKTNQIVADVAVKDGSTYLLVCSVEKKFYDNVKATFSAVLQSLSLK